VPSTNYCNGPVDSLESYRARAKPKPRIRAIFEHASLRPFAIILLFINASSGTHPPESWLGQLDAARAERCLRYQAIADASVDKNRSLASDTANYDIYMLESYTVIRYCYAVRQICLIVRGRLEI